MLFVVFFFVLFILLLLLLLFFFIVVDEEDKDSSNQKRTIRPASRKGFADEGMCSVEIGWKHGHLKYHVNGESINYRNTTSNGEYEQ